MFRLLILSLLVLTLWGCSSTEKTTTVVSKQQQPTKQFIKTVKNSAYYLEQAELYGSGQDQRSFYILAAKAAIAEQKSPLFIQGILNKIDITRRNSVKLDIELAKALLFVDMLEDAEVVNARLQQGQISRSHQVALRILSAQLTAKQNRHVDTVRTLFQILTFHSEQISDADTVLIYDLIWQHILKLPPQTLRNFQNDFGPASQAWINLAVIIQQDLNDAERLPKSLNRWRNLYPQSINRSLLPDQVQQLLQMKPFNPNVIALILPMSGRLAKQSAAIKDGFLTAMGFGSGKKLVLLDTDMLSLTQIEEQLIEQKVEFIVGPLQKNKVNEFQQSQVIRMLPRLNLNIPEIIPSVIPGVPASFYYSLAPEDEIEQAIEYFILNGVNRPAVIYADNRLGRRLFNRFNSAWQQATDETAEAIAFRNKSKLGEAVQSLLEVDDSRKRISEMKQIFGSRLETETRSRADIDAVYVIANSQQTRLIKPFFDVNISAFGNRLPIYASSRSYLVDETQEQKRDLDGMVFTEMPWLIENTEPQLHQIYATIGEQQTQLKKLFAFGYDAYQLLHALKQLAILPDEQLDGLTGKLSVATDLTITRELSWSRYTRGRVIALPKQTDAERRNSKTNVR